MPQGRFFVLVIPCAYVVVAALLVMPCVNVVVAVVVVVVVPTPVALATLVPDHTQLMVFENV